MIFNFLLLTWNSAKSFMQPSCGLQKCCCSVNARLTRALPNFRLLKQACNFPQLCLISAQKGIDQVSIRAEQAMNVTGSGVTVAVVDDGVQWDHPDLLANYNPKGSFDLNSNDDNPMPQYDENEENKHGTRCAGEIAAVPNDVCGVGVSFGAKFSGIRVLDGPITDSMEATAFNKHLG